MKRIISLLCAVLMLVTSFSQLIIASANQLPEPIALERSNAGNPLLGFDENGDILYGGDPSVMVEGDTVYLYVGCDISTDESYCMPDWRCYSSKDMCNWKYEGVIFKNSDITWAADGLQAWAAQPIKHNDKYYFYYCTEGNYTVGGGKCIGVAVSDSPTGPFSDIGQPLVRNIYETTSSVHSWEDIDPTVWVETVNGVEHRVLGWGNTRFFNAELNEDMISIKDVNNDGIIDIDGGDIKVGTIRGLDDHSGCYANNNQGLTCEDMGCSSHYFTEAPYYYRQQNEKGEYFGKYYMFFACDWREQMAYATADNYKDFINNKWNFGGVIQEPSATSNTNHMAVFDFKGQTYFVYHTGALPHGSGFRRVACVEPINVNKDGSIDYITKTATGLTGTAYTLQDLNGNYLEHKAFVNSLDDAFYKIKGKQLQLGSQINDKCAWVINNSKFAPDNANVVSIESNNKPGLYVCAELVNGEITPVLSQDIDGTADEAKAMSFKTYKGISGGIVLESVKYPCYYLVSRNNKLTFVHNASLGEASFIVSTNKQAASVDIQKTKKLYFVGENINDDDIQIVYTKPNGQSVFVNDYQTDANSLDMSTTGLKKLSVTYFINSIKYINEIEITVIDEGYTAIDSIEYTKPEKIENVVVNSILDEPSTATSVTPTTVGTAVDTAVNTAIPDGILIASYDFDGNLNNQLASNDKSTYKQTGLKNVFGSAKYTNGRSGKAVYLNDYGLKLNKGSLGDCYTISLWVKPDGYVDANTPIVFIGSDSPENWIAVSGDVRDNVKFWAHGGIYSDWRMMSPFKLTSNRWYNITITESNGKVTLYVDGFCKGTFDSNRPLCTDNADIYIGVNKWDEEFKGAIDDIAIYKSALTEAQVQGISLDDYTNTLQNKLNSELSKPALLGDNSSAENIKYDLSLPKALDGKSIIWSSSDPDVISDEGVVINPISCDETITLSATVNSGIFTATSKINVVVKPLDRRDFDTFLGQVKNKYSGDFFTADSYSKLTEAVNLAEKANSYSKITQSVKNIETAIAGLKYIPEYINPFEKIFLENNKTTLTLKKGSSAKIINIPYTVSDYINVNFYSGDSSVVSIVDDTITANNTGKAIVKAVVTSKFNKFSVDYSIAINVTEDKALLDVINEISAMSDDFSDINSANDSYNSLTDEQKNLVDFDLIEKLRSAIDKMNNLSVGNEIIKSEAGHIFAEETVTKVPTCKENGTKLYTCSCGEQKTVDIPALKHSSEINVNKAGINKNGSIVTICKFCKAQLNNEVIYAAKTFAISATEYVYDGKEKKPAVTVTDSNGKVISPSNYSVTYKNNKSVGKGTAIVTFKGNYAGEKKLEFKINPKPTTISKLTPAKKALTVKWKKQSAQTTGYEIQYSTNKNFKKGNKTVIIKKASATSKKITKLTGKKTYYVRIRTYKQIGKDKYYSAWSKAKSIRIK